MVLFSPVFYVTRCLGSKCQWPNGPMAKAQDLHLELAAGCQGTAAFPCARIPAVPCGTYPAAVNSHFGLASSVKIPIALATLTE